MRKPGVSCQNKTCQVCNSFQRVKLHQGKSTGNASKKYNWIPFKKQTQIGTVCIIFEHIPEKSSDISPMNYCAFCLLKRALVKEEWQAIS